VTVVGSARVGCRLVIVDPNNLALLGIAAVAGLVVHPWWWSWLGLSLRRSAVP